MPGLQLAPEASSSSMFSAHPPSDFCAAYSDFALRVVLQHGSSVTPVAPADLPTYLFTLVCRNPAAVTIHGLKSYVSSLGLHGLAEVSYKYDAREHPRLAFPLGKPWKCENKQRVGDNVTLPVPTHYTQQRKQHRVVVYTDDYFVVPETLTVADAFVSGELVHIRALDMPLGASDSIIPRSVYHSDVSSSLKRKHDDRASKLKSQGYDHSRSERPALEETPTCSEPGLHSPKYNQKTTAATEREASAEDSVVAVTESAEPLLKTLSQQESTVYSNEASNAADTADIAPPKSKRRKNQRGKRVATKAFVEAEQRVAVVLESDLSVSPSRAALSPTRRLSDAKADACADLDPESLDHCQNDIITVEDEVRAEESVAAVSESAEPPPSLPQPKPTVCNSETISPIESSDTASAKPKRRKGQRGKRVTRTDVDSEPQSAPVATLDIDLIVSTPLSAHSPTHEQSESMLKIPAAPSRCEPATTVSPSQPVRAASPMEEPSPESLLNAPSATRKKKRGPRRKRPSKHATGTPTAEPPAAAAAAIPALTPCLPPPPANLTQPIAHPEQPESRKRSAVGDDEKENDAADGEGNHKRKRRRGRRSNTAQADNAGTRGQQQQQQRSTLKQTSELAVTQTTAAPPSAAILSTSASSESGYKQEGAVPMDSAAVTSRRRKRRKSQHVPLNTIATIVETPVSPPPLASPSPPPYPAPDADTLRTLTDALAIADLPDAFLDDIAWVSTPGSGSVGGSGGVADVDAAEALLDSALNGLLDRAPAPALAPLSTQKAKDTTAGGGKEAKRARDPARQRREAIWDQF
ncbi:hypothetical protein HDU89_000081 [Geranomyces variabilis]|nr:hypothetical protein HDU89_000081 [Geranomyces variabilis]